MKRTSLVFQNYFLERVKKDPGIENFALPRVLGMYSNFIRIVYSAPFVEEIDRVVPAGGLEYPYGVMVKFSTLLDNSFLVSVCQKTVRLVAEVGLSPKSRNIFLILAFCPSGQGKCLSRIRITFDSVGDVLSVRRVSV